MPMSRSCAEAGCCQGFSFLLFLRAKAPPRFPLCEGQPKASKLTTLVLRCLWSMAFISHHIDYPREASMNRPSP